MGISNSALFVPPELSQPVWQAAFWAEGSSAGLGLLLHPGSEDLYVHLDPMNLWEKVVVVPAIWGVG